jgi:hypothetical protein
MMVLTLRPAALLLALLVVSGCTGRAPLAASEVAAAAPHLTLGCSGQSNADFLCRSTGALPQLADVVGYQLGARRIVCWDEFPDPAYDTRVDWGPLGVGYCWSFLRPTLSQRMDAFIWWQGEYDANDRPAPGYYTAKLANLMARVRAANGNPNLLIAIVQINAEVYDGTTVQAELATWARSDAHAVYVPTAGLPYADGAHMTDDYDHPGLSPQYQEVARRIVSAVHAKLGR